MFARVRCGIAPFVPLLAFAILSCGPIWAAGPQKKPLPASKIAPQATAVPAAKPVLSYSLTPGFTVKPSEVVLPSDAPLGKYRRVVQPFPNWTLICDENLAKKQKVCNISQTIVDSGGVNVFSWSLAANENGQPILILRTPPSVGEGATVKLDFSDGGPAVPVVIQGCTAQVCLAYQPVAERLRAAVAKGLVVEISYASGSPRTAISFRAPLDGLASALAAI